MRCSLVTPLARSWILLWTLCPASALAVPERPVLEGDAIEPPKVAASAAGTPIIATDTIWIADWSFDLPGGGCTDAGWVKYDNRILNDGSNYWSIKDVFAGIGGITDNAAVLSKHDLTWCTDGYGNDWDYSIILEYQGASTLTFSYLADTEPGFDFVLVEADSLGLSESRVDYSTDPAATPSEFRLTLFSDDGLQNATVGPLPLPDFGVPLGVHEVYIRLQSDGGYGPEDCLYPVMYPGLIVDNIVVSGALTYSEDFEATLGPNVTFANTAPATPFGEWARVFEHITDNDGCSENTTCAWLWTDPSRLALSPAMAFGPGAAVVRNWLDDVIVSPWVSLAGQPGPGPTLLSYRRFPGNGFNQSRIVQNWSVRSVVRIDNTDTSIPGDSIDAVTPWEHSVNWNSLSLFAWESRVADMSDYLGWGARAIQIRFRVSDWQYIAGAASPIVNDPGPGPYMDRVRIGRVTYAGPSIDGVACFFTAGDGFPSEHIPTTAGEDFAPTTDRFGTIDFAAASFSLEDHYPETPWEYNSRDSIHVRVVDVRSAGVTGVGIYAAIVSGPHAGKAPAPWSLGANGFFYVPADSVRHPYTGAVVPGDWFVDLDDEYFRGGDVLAYFWAATDAGGGFSSLPEGLTTIPSSIAEAQQATAGLFEVNYLPTIDWDPAYLARIAAHASGKLDPTPEEIAASRQSSCILYYWLHAPARRSGPAHRSAFMATLDQLGYGDLYDVYYQTGTFLNYSTHLAGRATPEQATGYPLVIQDTENMYGNLLIPPGELREGVIDQQSWYQSWLTQAAASESGRSTLWLVGENLVDDAVMYNNPLVLVDMGVTQTTSSQSLGPYPNIAGQSAFTWAHGGSTDFTGDIVTLNSSGCAIRGNDGLGATGTAVVTHRYALGSTVGEGAAVMNANAAASWNSILMSFAWDDLLDVPGTPPGNRRADLMEKVLNGVLPDSCRQGANPTGVPDDPAALPRATTLHPNVPNPFNPTTTIRFDLAHAGRVKLEIFDVSGRRVRTLVDEWLAAGWDHRVTWNGQDATGQRVASGIYLYRLVAGELESTRKMIVLK